MPYALARPALSAALSQGGPPAEERRLMDDVTERVRLWSKLEPYYSFQPAQSRGTESVLNALILSSFDARSGKLSEDARAALANMWALQNRDGEFSGSWPWIEFRNEPWEALDSPYYGACLAAIAVGLAPQDYSSAPELRTNIELLEGYLRRESRAQTPINRLMLLWASVELPGTLSREQQEAIVKEVAAQQQSDGGWSLSSLVGTWKRRDGTPQVATSDGAATGLVTYVFELAEVESNNQHLKAGLSWLARNQRWRGGWNAYSLNRRHWNPFSNASYFMDDAATAYGALALTHSNPASIQPSR